MARAPSDIDCSDPGGRLLPLRQYIKRYCRANDRRTARPLEWSGAFLPYAPTLCFRWVLTHLRSRIWMSRETMYMVPDNSCNILVEKNAGLVLRIKTSELQGGVSLVDFPALMGAAKENIKAMDAPKRADASMDLAYPSALPLTWV